MYRFTNNVYIFVDERKNKQVKHLYYKKVGDIQMYVVEIDGSDAIYYFEFYKEVIILGDSTNVHHIRVKIENNLYEG